LVVRGSHHLSQRSRIIIFCLFNVQGIWYFRHDVARAIVFRVHVREPRVGPHTIIQIPSQQLPYVCLPWWSKLSLNLPPTYCTYFLSARALPTFAFNCRAPMKRSVMSAAPLIHY
jgi:hypothetical protein